MAHIAYLKPAPQQTQYDRTGYTLFTPKEMTQEEVADTQYCCGDDLHAIAFTAQREGFGEVELSITPPRTVQWVRGIVK